MKKKKTRKFRIVIFIVILIILCLLVIVLKNHSDLKGEKIADYIYLYNISDKENVPVQIRDGNIYYLVEDQKIYTLYKRNIYSKENVKVGIVEGENTYCVFNNSLIVCANANNNYYDYYDYELNHLYRKTYDNNDSSEVVYYQGKIMILDNKKLYENGNLVKELAIDDPNVRFNGYIEIGNNTFLIYSSTIESSYFYYDISNDKYEEQPKKTWARYDEGFYLPKSDEIFIDNKLTNELKHYTNFIYNENVLVNTLKDNKFYFADDNKVYVVDLDNSMISRIEHEFDKPINQIVCDKEYIYLMSFDHNCDVYVVNKDKVNKTTYTIDEYKKYMDNMVDERVKNIEEKYHIDIVYKDEVKVNNNTFEAESINNNYIILDALNTVEKALQRFSIEFFDRFNDEHKGLVIYLTGELNPDEEDDTVLKAKGYALLENNQSGIVLDITKAGLESAIYHEIMHNTETIMKNFSYDEWLKKNPLNFNYMLTYRTEANYSYTLFEKDANKVYFIDEYSKSFPTEDIARIFENICTGEKQLSDYPHLYEKAVYLKEKLEEEFPSLKGSMLFDNLNNTQLDK